jgi:hypothetical protein
MGDSGAAPQQRPSERYWFFPPASRRPWLTTRSPLRRIRRHKDPWPQPPRRSDCPRRPVKALPELRAPRGTVHPGMRETAGSERTNPLRDPGPREPRARHGPFFRCRVPCFRRPTVPRPRGPRRLPRPVRRPPKRRRHLAREPQPLPLRPALRPPTGQSLPRRPGPPLRQRRPLTPQPALPRWPGRRPRQAFLRPVGRPPEHQQEGLLPPPEPRQQCRAPAARAVLSFPRPPWRAAVLSACRAPTVQAVLTPHMRPPCQRRCPSTRASPSPPARRTLRAPRPDRDRQFPPPAHCLACPMPWCGWVRALLAWERLPAWCSCGCAASKGEHLVACYTRECDFAHFYEL